MRLGEFNVDFKHAKVKDMAIADGLACIPYDQPWTWCKEWEDVCMAEVASGDRSFQYFQEPA